MMMDNEQGSWKEVTRMQRYTDALALKQAVEEQFGGDVRLLDCSDSVYPMLGSVRVLVNINTMLEGTTEQQLEEFVLQWQEK